MRGPALFHQVARMLSVARNRRVVVALRKRWMPKLSLGEFTYITGMLGIAIIVVSVLLTALAFSGPDNSAYSVLNRKISTLGKPQYSKWAMLFNWGLQIGGFVLMVFIVSLSLYVKRRAIIVVTVAGLVMAGAVAVVGICPVTEPDCHRVAAQVTFFSGAVSTFSFTIVLLYSKPTKLAQWLVVPSGIASAAFVAFVAILAALYENPQKVFIRGPLGDVRPVLWVPALLEWLVFTTVVIWLFTIVLDIAGRTHRQARDAALGHSLVGD